jgi:hypothetical protein
LTPEEKLKPEGKLTPEIAIGVGVAIKSDGEGEGEGEDNGDKSIDRRELSEDELVVVVVYDLEMGILDRN